jgi:hypothetical protein
VWDGLLLKGFGKAKEEVDVGSVLAAGGKDGFSRSSCCNIDCCSLLEEAMLGGRSKAGMVLGVAGLVVTGAPPHCDLGCCTQAYSQHGWHPIWQNTIVMYDIL